MSHRLKLTLGLAGIVVATATAGIVLPGHRRVILAAGVMVLLGVLLIEMAGLAYRLAEESSAWARVRHVATPSIERPADLERIERRLGWGQYSVGDFNYRVRPMLRRLAAARLRNSHGIVLDQDLERAHTVTSSELWDHVIAKQPPSSERVITTADIARLVDEIEGL